MINKTWINISSSCKFIYFKSIINGGRWKNNCFSIYFQFPMLNICMIQMKRRLHHLLVLRCYSGWLICGTLCWWHHVAWWLHHVAWRMATVPCSMLAVLCNVSATPHDALGTPCGMLAWKSLTVWSSLTDWLSLTDWPILNGWPSLTGWTSLTDWFSPTDYLTKSKTK